jgi:subtilisin family serine protease
MPTAKLIIENATGGRPHEINRLAGSELADYRALSQRFSLADTGQHVGRAADAWDIAYKAVLESPGQFFEPDFPSGFYVHADTPTDGAGLAAARDLPHPHDQVAGDIKGPCFGWHRLDQFAQLERARLDAEAGSPAGVRVAICDVGFDLDHSTYPKDRVEHARNFLPDAAADNVRDRNVQGFNKNPGHGTATLALLAAGALPAGIVSAESVAAGAFLGATPQAKVIPLRIATSVVLLDTSTFVQAIEYLLELDARGIHTDVVSMSMGGVGSSAWADVVNRAYEKGILIVSAAGNNIPLLLGLRSPSSTVFPARFNRVISATGITASFHPYANLKELSMWGNYGPKSKMRTAVAAFTPNAPWAELGSPLMIDLDGQGTSAATPQVAGAAALYLRKYKPAMAGWQPWEVAEATRRALFQSARKDLADQDTTVKYYGAGVLATEQALLHAPAKPDAQEQKDSAFLPAFKVIFGDFPFGLRAGPEQDNARRMLWLETVQLIHRDARVEAAVADPDSGVMTPEEQRTLQQAILESPEASDTLKRAIDGNYRSMPRTPARRQIAPPPPEVEPEPPEPVNRRLQAYAFDPSFSGSFATYEFNRVTLDVPWEELGPGPKGEYIEVIDHDPSSGCFYPAVNLEHPQLLATDGLAPSAGSPMFHQQMVYAVAMRTIRNFELALGRRVQWSPLMKEGDRDDSVFVQRLRIYPHALRERNAYYHPGKKALLFGYFQAQPIDPGELLSGGMTFSCLSHDIVAHETTHAILDGIYRNFNNPTNPDQLAFHEAFADLAALLQHFTITRVVESQIRATRGRLDLENALFELAREFGKATGLHGALRTAIGGGTDPKTGRPDYAALGKTTEIHDRGAILVGAVFDAFLKIYSAKTADLRRIATGGTGNLPRGEISPDLIHRFASEASDLASQFLLICIRALDYCPPVDLNFGDYLRALITADHDLVPSDPWGYRIAIAESFRQRAIFPKGMPMFGEETLLWHRPEIDLVDKLFQHAGEELEQIDQFVHIDPGPGRCPVPPLYRRPDTPEYKGAPEYLNARQEIFRRSRKIRKDLHNKMANYINALPAEDRLKLARQLGLDWGAGRPGFEVHTIAVAERQGPDGRMVQQFVVTLVQKHCMPADGGDAVEVWSGSTVLLERSNRKVRYVIRKSCKKEHLDESVSFALDQLAGDNPYFRVSSNQRFALIHASGGLSNE